MKCNRALVFGLALALALGAAGTPAAGVEVETTETTTTTTYSGTVTEVTPSSTIIVRSSRPAETPRMYAFTKKTIFLDPLGNVVSAEVTRGKPVTVYYTTEGDQLVVSKVVISRPVTESETRTEVYREVR